MPRQASLVSAKMPALQAQHICGTVQSTTAAGSTAADATKITSALVLFTTASAGGGAFPSSNPGDSFELKNESGNTVTLYPSASAGTVTINGTTSLSFPTAKSCRVWFSTATACHSTPTVVS